MTHFSYSLSPCANRFAGRVVALLNNASGQIGVLLSLSILPIMGFIGIAVDSSRLYAEKAALQVAADAAALAGAQANPATLANAQAAAGKVFYSQFDAASASMVLTQQSGGVTKVVATKTVSSTIMRAMNFQNTTIHATSETVAFSGGAIEVALALDNTGSMVNDMPALRTAATNLVNSLFASANGNSAFKMSVVPFVASVNPGRSVLEANGGVMIDKAGSSRWNGNYLKWAWLAHTANCTQVWGGGGGGGGSSGPGSGGSGAQLFEGLKPLGTFASQILGFGGAQADSGVTPGTMIPLSGSIQSSVGGKWVPTGFNFNARADWNGWCDVLSNPGTISNWDLFQRIPTTTSTGAAWGGWKGCVEARPNLSDGAAKDYDVIDDAPVNSDANSQFTPYFWPDEADQFDTGWVPIYNNDYLPDGRLQSGSTTQLMSDPTGNPMNYSSSKQWGNFTGDVWRRNFSILKYNGVNRAKISEAGINTTGPNKACPDAVLPLTNTQSSVLTKISNMTYWNGGGTIVSEGLMWAWRTLSPNSPYATALPYATQNQKVIVLMTDGKNELGENGRDFWGNIDWSPMYSDYTAYGYLRYGRYGAESFATATSFLNTRLTTACANAKAKGIIVYTVLFRETDPTIKSLLQSCASKPDNAFTSANGADLNAAFGVIGSSISQLRLKK